MTSGNVSDEPIAYADEDAIARLAGIADAFLVHDRPIHMRTDDSVVRARRSGAPMMMRRSRGYVPGAIGLPIPCAAPLLACGAELKSTFCVAKGEQAWVSHHIGDLKNYETLRSFGEGVEHFQRLFAVTPRGDRARPAPRLSLDRLCARARSCRATRARSEPDTRSVVGWRSAPPRPSGRLSGRARRARARRWA